MNNYDCLICVDAGTTNTRVWLTEGERILARAQVAVGVRDTARDGSPARLHSALRNLISEVRQKSGNRPIAVIAAGMITSSLGLVDVPHVPAPAGVDELASNIQSHSFPEITDLPILLVPGVRSGPKPCDLDSVAASDLMRGEETLCIGLIENGMIQPPGAVLNLGSHWKAIRIDSAGRVAASVTSLAGELIHAAQTQTILASAVPNSRPESIDQKWLDAGMREQRQAGLARALFCVRLLEQSQCGTPEQRLSFLIGAFVSSEIDSLFKNEVLRDDSTVAITGGGALNEAWRLAFERVSIPAVSLSNDETETGQLVGLLKLMLKCRGVS